MTPESRIQLERRVLAALYAGTRKGSIREAARARLASYAWSDGAHQAVFEIVMAFPSASPDALRDQLPARLTRRGFPDFDFAALFEAPEIAPAEAEVWMARLNEPGSRGW